MFVNFSSSALSTHTVEGFENNRNICEKLMFLYLYIYIYISIYIHIYIIYTSIHIYIYISIYIYIYIYIYIWKNIYISGHNWSTTLRVLKSHRRKMSVIYIKQCALSFITTMALWQATHALKYINYGFKWWTVHHVPKYIINICMKKEK